MAGLESKIQEISNVINDLIQQTDEHGENLLYYDFVGGTSDSAAVLHFILKPPTGNKIKKKIKSLEKFVEEAEDTFRKGKFIDGKTLFYLGELLREERDLFGKPVPLIINDLQKLVNRLNSGFLIAKNFKYEFLDPGKPKVDVTSESTKDGGFFVGIQILEVFEVGIALLQDDNPLPALEPEDPEALDLPSLDVAVETPPGPEVGTNDETQPALEGTGSSVKLESALKGATQGDETTTDAGSSPAASEEEPEVAAPGPGVGFMTPQQRLIQQQRQKKAQEEESAVAELEERVTSYQEKIDALKAELQEKDHALASKDEEIADLEKIIRVMRDGDKAPSTDDFGMNQSKVQALEVALAEVNAQLNILREELTRKDNEIAALEQQLAELRGA